MIRYTIIICTLLSALAATAQRRIITIPNISQNIYTTASAATYINAYRQDMGPENVIVLDTDTRPDYYRLFDTTNLYGRICRSIGVDTSDEIRIGEQTMSRSQIFSRQSVDSAGYRRIVVTDVTYGDTPVFSTKYVDVSDFQPDREIMTAFSADIDRLKNLDNIPITYIDSMAVAADGFFRPSRFSGLFHEFQLAESGADVSLFSPPTYDAAIQIGNLTLSDLRELLVYRTHLAIVHITGRDLHNRLEKIYTRSTRTMHNAQDDMLNLRLAAYNHITAAGITYTVNLTKDAGNKITITSMSDGTRFDESRTYSVVLNSYVASKFFGSGTSIEMLKDDYMYMFINWLRLRSVVSPRVVETWTAVPVRWQQQAEGRGIKSPAGR